MSLACALMGSPEIIVMDEPLNGLDPLAQRAFTNLMRQLSSKGIAIVISSHQVSDLEALADKIALLHHGQVLIDGTLEHIRGKLKLDSDSDIVEMICAVTGIQPDEISLDIARDSIMPLRKPGGEEE
jgi:ABC-type multidrug transport system ATPase subunit